MFEVLLWIIFIASAIILAVVILLQESKGGGLAEAFGGMGQQTFGVKASGINKFTAYLAIAFLLSAVLITVIRSDDSVISDSDFQSQPAESGLPGDMKAPPAGPPKTGETDGQ